MWGTTEHKEASFCDHLYPSFATDKNGRNHVPIYILFWILLYIETGSTRRMRAQNDLDNRNSVKNIYG